MNISMTKDELLAHLTKQLAIAKAEDVRRTASHEKDEAKALEKFRSKLRDALKWDYKTVLKNKRNYRELSLEQPDCPKLDAPFFEGLIASLKLDSRDQKFLMHEQSDLHNAVTWLPESKRPKLTPCDD